MVLIVRCLSIFRERAIFSKVHQNTAYYDRLWCYLDDHIDFGNYVHVRMIIIIEINIYLFCEDEKVMNRRE